MGCSWALTPSLSRRERVRGCALCLDVGTLLVAAADRRAEDVAQGGAAVGGAEVLARLLGLLRLAARGGERELAASAVDRGDLGVHLLADGEALRSQVALVARQL